MTKAQETLRRFCYRKRCYGCPFNKTEYSYNEYDDEGDSHDICALEEAEESLQELFDIYEECKDKPSINEDALWEEVFG